MKISFFEAASVDVVRQFRYYLVDCYAPQAATRFRDAVRETSAELLHHPMIGANCGLRNPRLKDIRSWPVAGFPRIRVYYKASNETLHVVRILHDRQNVRLILARTKWTVLP